MTFRRFIFPSLSLFALAFPIVPSAFAEGIQDRMVQTRGSVVNTTFNTTYENGRWTATMGPLTDFFGGLACDHRAKEQGDAEKFRKGDHAIWFVAPSDAISALGLKHCGPNPYGGEPSCVENWDLCGRKMRVSCEEGSPWCASPGSSSLLAEINSGRPPLNNYMPDYYVKRTAERVGSRPSVPRSIVLYITDFCPKDHSENKRGNQCQTPQLDVATSAFLLLAKKNPQGYINADVTYKSVLLDEKDPTPAGPEWSSPSSYPPCTAEGGRGYGDTWQNGNWTLAKNEADLNEGSICVVSP